MRGFPLQQHAVLQFMLRCFPWYCPHSPLLSTDLSQLHQHLDRHRQGAEGVESVREASMRQLLSMCRAPSRSVSASCRHGATAERCRGRGNRPVQSEWVGRGEGGCLGWFTAMGMTLCESACWTKPVCTPLTGCHAAARRLPELVAAQVTSALRHVFRFLWTREKQQQRKVPACTHLTASVGSFRDPSLELSVVFSEQGGQPVSAENYDGASTRLCHSDWICGSPLCNSQPDKAVRPAPPLSNHASSLIQHLAWPQQQPA